MSDNVKIAGIVTSGLACAILVVAYVVEPLEWVKQMAISFGGVFGLFFPLPAIWNTAKKLFSKV